MWRRHHAAKAMWRKQPAGEPVERSPQATRARHAVSHEVASECSPGIHPGVHGAKRPKAPEGRQRVHAPARCRPYVAWKLFAIQNPRLRRGPDSEGPTGLKSGHAALLVSCS